MQRTYIIEPKKTNRKMNFGTDINRSNKGAIGEHLVTAHLLLQGYDVAIANFTVKNSKTFDLFCHNDETGLSTTIQVKTTLNGSFYTGLTHKDFLNNGNVDIAYAQKQVEKHIQCPWVFVDINGTKDDPDIRYFILSPTQLVHLIVKTEEWYLTGYNNRKKPLSENGTINILAKWFTDNPILEAAKTSHIELPNPLVGCKVKGEWSNIWKK